MRPILVRHGRTEANAMQTLDTAFPGNPLDEVEPEQADGLPDCLDKAGLPHGLGSLWTSPVPRVEQTIAPIEAITDLSTAVNSGLREVLTASPEMNTDARSMACYVGTTRAWMAGRLAAHIPGSPEDGHDTLQRFDEAVGRVCKQAAQTRNSAVLLVSYGTVLHLRTSPRATAGEGADPLWAVEHPLRNTDITVAEGGPGEDWRLPDWNDGVWWVADAGPLVPRW